MENGAWRDTSSLDFGVPKKKEIMWFICVHCNNLLQIDAKSIGIICSKCKKYCSISDEQRIPSERINEKLKELGIVPKGQAFHFPNKELVEFRDGMEKKAYNWRDKQIAKRQTPGYEPTYHGPIDPDTGKRIK